MQPLAFSSTGVTGGWDHKESYMEGNSEIINGMMPLKTHEQITRMNGIHICKDQQQLCTKAEGRSYRQEPRVRGSVGGKFWDKLLGMQSNTQEPEVF